MTFYIGAGKKLSDASFANLAKQYNIDEALLRAVNEVESAGSGVSSAGAVTALYEPHKAYSLTSGTIRNALVKAGIAYPKQGTKPYPKSSYPRIDQCALIAGEEIAAQATSWGLGQIMGFNFKAAGYSSAVAMVKAFAESEENQLAGMISFIKANTGMFTALVKHDWATFARLYNGPAYKRNNYDTKMAKAYAKWAKVIASKPAELPIPKEDITTIKVTAGGNPPKVIDAVVVPTPKPVKPRGWNAIISFLAMVASAVAYYLGFH